MSKQSWLSTIAMILAADKATIIMMAAILFYNELRPRPQDMFTVEYSLGEKTSGGVIQL